MHFVSLDLPDQEGVFAWTQAVRGVGKRGLPMLSHISLHFLSNHSLCYKKTPFVDLASALMDYCPRLQRIAFGGEGDW